MKARIETFNKLLFMLVFLLIFNFSGCSPKTAEPGAGFIPTGDLSKQESPAGSNQCSYKKTAIDGLEDIVDIAPFNGAVLAVSGTDSTVLLCEENNLRPLYRSETEFLSSVAVLGDGIWLYGTEFLYDEAAQTGTDEPVLKKISADGKEVLSARLSQNEKYDEKYGQIVNLVSGAEVLFAQFENAVGIFDPNGNWLYTAEPDEGEFIVKTAAFNGKICCQVLTDKGTFLREIDSTGGCIDGNLEISSYIFASMHDNRLLVTDEFGLYEIDPSDAERTPVVIWAENGISFSHIDEIIPASEQELLVLDSGQVYKLERTGNTAAAEKETVHLAVLSPSYDCGIRVDQFNRSSTKYNVVIDNYYDTTGSTENAVKLLNTQLISGAGPDLIYFSGFSPQPYAGHGFLVDLYTYLDNDPELGREDFIALGCMESNGGLFTVSPGFYIDTFLGLESVFGERYCWTLDEYFEMESQLTGEASMIFNNNREDFLRFSLPNYIDSAIDWQSGTCDFDNGTFRAVLESAKNIKEAAVLDDESYTGASNEALVANGVNKFMYTRLDGISKFVGFEKAVNREFSLIGWPTPDGSCGSQLVPSARFGMTTNAACHEGAWEFIRFMISDMGVQESVSNSAFPIRRAALDAQVKALREPFSEFAGSEIIPGENGGFYADGVFYDLEYDPTPLASEKQIAKIYGLLDEMKSLNESYNVVYPIVYEEAAAYFAGDRGLDDTVKLIQSRISIYVAEQMS